MKSILTFLLLFSLWGLAHGQTPLNSYVVEAGVNFTIAGGSSDCYDGNCSSGNCMDYAKWYKYGFENPKYSSSYTMPNFTDFSSTTSLTTSKPVGTHIIDYVRIGISQFDCNYGPDGSYQSVKDITIYSEASLTFAPPASVCTTGGTLDLLTYTNKVSGQLGTTFTREPGGINIPLGVFNPATLGAGTYTVRATYNFYSGVKSVDRSITVNATPSVSTTLADNYCASGSDLNLNTLFSATPTSSVAFSCVGGTCNGSQFYTAGPDTFLNLDFNGTASTFTTTIRATYTNAGCVNSLDKVITITANPTLYTVGGGGSYCSGGTGVTVTLSGSQTGVKYQLKDDGTNVGSPVNGTNGALSWTNQTASGTYTIVATTDALPGCSLQMTGSTDITVNPLPSLYVVGGGGQYCAGGSGLSITLSNSQVGVNYQLKLGGVDNGAVVAGTGAALSWANKTAGGTYTVLATNSTTSCFQTMSGNASITVNPVPTTYTVAGGGAYCSGGTGVTITLSGSQSGIQYQLLRGGVNDGAAIVGTGSALSWANKTTAATYTVIATNSSTLCQATMSNNAIVTVNPLPTVYVVSGGGSYCSGGTGVSVSINGSQTGINYQLRKDGVNDGSAVAGTGLALNWTNKTAGGVYTVVATNATTSCASTMTASATVTVNPLPTLFTLSGGGAVCGGSGLTITLSGTQTGANYQLRKDGVNDGSAVAGTGSAINWTNKTTGVYTVVSTLTATSCSTTMTGSASVTLSPAPTNYTVSGGGSYCSGGTGLNINISDTEIGVNYQVKRGGVNVGTATAGTGNAMSWNQTVAGTYTVTATHATSSCVLDMSGSAVITVNPAPSGNPTFTVSPSAVVCGNSSFTVTAAGLVAGEMYRWTNSTGVEVQLSTSPTYTTAVHTPGTYKYFVYRRTSLGCQSQAVEINLEVNATATISWTTPNAQICGSSTGIENLTTTFAPTPSGGTYTSTNTLLQSKLSGTNNTLLDLAGLTPGTYPITYTVTGSCSAVASTTLVVKAGTVVPIVADTKLCGPGTTTLTVSNIDPALHYEWFDVATSGSSLGSGTTFTTPNLTSNTTYYVQAVNISSACTSARDAALVTVVTLPTVNAGLDIGFCTNNVTVNLAGDASPAGGVFSGDGVTGSTFNGNSVANNATYTITYTVTVNGCEVVDTREISLGFDIELELTPGDTVEIGELVTIKHNYANALTTAWNFGDGWTGSTLNALHYYYQPGNKNVTLSLTLPGGCSQTRTFDSLVFVNGDFGVITGGIETEGPAPTVFPNPFKSDFTLLFNENRKDVYAFLSDLTGRPITKSPKEIKMGENEIIPSEDAQVLAPGMYILKLNHNNSTQYIKIIKQ